MRAKNKNEVSRHEGGVASEGLGLSQTIDGPTKASPNETTLKESGSAHYLDKTDFYVNTPSWKVPKLSQSVQSGNYMSLMNSSPSVILRTQNSLTRFDEKSEPNIDERLDSIFERQNKFLYKLLADHDENYVHTRQDIEKTEHRLQNLQLEQETKLSKGLRKDLEREIIKKHKHKKKKKERSKSRKKEDVPEDKNHKYKVNFNLLSPIEWKYKQNSPRNHHPGYNYGFKNLVSIKPLNIEPDPKIVLKDIDKKYKKKKKKIPKPEYEFNEVRVPFKVESDEESDVENEEANHDKILSPLADNQSYLAPNENPQIDFKQRSLQDNIFDESQRNAEMSTRIDQTNTFDAKIEKNLSKDFDKSMQLDLSQSNMGLRKGSEEHKQTIIADDKSIFSNDSMNRGQVPTRKVSEEQKSIREPNAPEEKSRSDKKDLSVTIKGSETKKSLQNSMISDKKTPGQDILNTSQRSNPNLKSMLNSSNMLRLPEFSNFRIQPDTSYMTTDALQMKLKDNLVHIQKGNRMIIKKKKPLQKVSETSSDSDTDSEEKSKEENDLKSKHESKEGSKEGSASNSEESETEAESQESYDSNQVEIVEKNFGKKKKEEVPDVSSEPIQKSKYQREIFKQQQEYLAKLSDLRKSNRKEEKPIDELALIEEAKKAAQEEIEEPLKQDIYSPHIFIKNTPAVPYKFPQKYTNSTSIRSGVFLSPRVMVEMRKRNRSKLKHVLWAIVWPFFFLDVIDDVVETRKALMKAELEKNLFPMIDIAYGAVFNWIKTQLREMITEPYDCFCINDLTIGKRKQAEENLSQKGDIVFKHVSSILAALTEMVNSNFLPKPLLKFFCIMQGHNGIPLNGFLTPYEIKRLQFSNYGTLINPENDFELISSIFIIVRILIQKLLYKPHEFFPNVKPNMVIEQYDGNQMHLQDKDKIKPWKYGALVGFEDEAVGRSKFFSENEILNGVYTKLQLYKFWEANGAKMMENFIKRLSKRIAMVYEKEWKIILKKKPLPFLN